MARYNEYGELVFLGRRNAQIKILGHRVELGEIENVVMRQAAVAQARCVYVAEVQSTVLFYAGEVEPDALRTALSGCLPSYMLPRQIYRKTALPMTANGKTDRRALLLEAVAILTKKEMI
jgi:acyl-coenzyme A synthetase/AMP-(fatty) acid ligase